MNHHAPRRRLGDRAFHTLHADLHAVGGAPLQSGFVNDVHTNGVVNGAHQIYHLNGASPNTTYRRHDQPLPRRSHVHDGADRDSTATIMTNGAGNGNGRFTFPAGPPS
jgi:hypothetical protein